MPVCTPVCLHVLKCLYVCRYHVSMHPPTVACMYVRMYAYLCLYACPPGGMHAWMCPSVCVCVCVSIYIYNHGWMGGLMDGRIGACRNANAIVCMYACVCVCQSLRPCMLYGASTLVKSTKRRPPQCPFL